MNIVWIVINQTSSWDEPDEISIRGIFDSKSKAIDYVDSQFYTKKDENKVEVIVKANSREKADYRLYYDSTIIDFSYLDELSEEEAALSGLDII